MKTEEYIKLIKEGNLTKAEEVRQSTIPAKLIKFFWLDGSETDEKKFQTLAEDKIWFSHKQFLNDPYEFKGMMIDRKKMSDAGYPEEVIEQYREVLKFDGYGITCLSANAPDYLPMWAYYANNHQGFCVEYTVIGKDCVREVSYEPERIKVASLIVEYVSAAREAMRLKKRTPKADLCCTILIQNLFMKAEQWKHEKEYRIVYPIHKENGKNIPVRQLGLRTNRIIAGTKCRTESIERLNTISNNLGLGNVYKSYIHPEKYTVKIEQ